MAGLALEVSEEVPSGSAAAAWDLLLSSGQFMSSSGWLQLVERARPAKRWYLAWRDPSTRVLARGLVCELISTDSPSKALRPDWLVAGTLGYALPDGADDLMPALLCGGRPPALSAVVGGVGHGQQEGGMSEALREVAALAARVGARSLLFPSVADPVLGCHLAAAGFLKAGGDQAATLDVRWPNWDGYLASLGPEWRRSVRREIRRLEDAGVAVTVGRLEEADVRTLAELSELTGAKYGSANRASDWLARYRGYLASFGNECWAATAMLGTELVAGAVFLEWRQEWYACGYGALPGEPRGAYFAVNFYSPIHRAIGSGITRIEYGLGSVAAKAARGCRLAPVTAYVGALEWIK